MTWTTELQRIRRNQRRRSQRLFFRAHPEPFARCHWCKESIVWYYRLPVWRRLGIAGKFALVKVNGKGLKYRMATIDHVKELCFGGSTNISNLVAACQTCNYGRAPNIEEPRGKHCVDCGTLTRGASRRRCKKCSEHRYQEYFNKSDMGRMVNGIISNMDVATWAR